MTGNTPGKRWRLRRLADDHGILSMLAIDQRPPIRDLVASARGESDARPEDVAHVKRLLASTLGRHASAVLIDPAAGYPAVHDVLDPRRGLLLTLEHDVFEATTSGRLSGPIPEWSVDAIARTGADAVKALAWYRPDAGKDVNEHQRRWIEAVGAECERQEIPLLLELLLYPLGPDRPIPTDPSTRASLVIESYRHFADSRADIFKVESPVPPSMLAPLDSREGTEHHRFFVDLDVAVGRPWVVLSAGASREQFERVLTHACSAGASGFLAGRAIWAPALAPFPDLDECERRLRVEAVQYAERLVRIASERGRPWWERT
jgi:tagatose 1,6-diphosphate aldolase